MITHVFDYCGLPCLGFKTRKPLEKILDAYMYPPNFTIEIESTNNVVRCTLVGTGTQPIRYRLACK
jgi:hypothetical protein